jgi:hypothetical protein
MNMRSDERGGALMSLGFAPTPVVRTPQAAKRGWGLSFVVALACVVGFAADAFRLQSWLLVAALCIAALASIVHGAGV